MIWCVHPGSITLQVISGVLSNEIIRRSSSLAVYVRINQGFKFLVFTGGVPGAADRDGLENRSEGLPYAGSNDPLRLFFFLALLTRQLQLPCLR